MARSVRFQDIDAAGILYYPRAFEYFHDAYLAHLAAHGIDVPAVLRERTWGAPLAHAEADFRAPMYFGDPIVVEIEGAEVGRSSLSVRYRVRADSRETDPKVYCSGKTVHVFLDVTTFRPRDLPGDVRAAFSEPKAVPAA